MVDYTLSKERGNSTKPYAHDITSPTYVYDVCCLPLRAEGVKLWLTIVGYTNHRSPEMYNVIDFSHYC